MEGPMGPIGPTGDSGRSGSQGPQGVPGPQGGRGPTGLTGPNGRQGLLGFPNSSVPVRIQIFTGTSRTTLLSPDPGDFNLKFAAVNVSAGSPPLDDGDSTTIPGMSISETGNGVLVPIGKYFVQGAASIPIGFEATTGYIGLFRGDSDEVVIQGSGLSENTTIHGTTAIFSGVLDVSTSSRYRVAFYIYSPIGGDIPLIIDSGEDIPGSIGVFVTFIKIN